MKTRHKNEILVNGRIKSAGVTFFTRNGQTIARTSVSMQPRRMTEKQFAIRERLAHNRLLWLSLQPVVAPLMTGDRSPYGSFCFLAAPLPTVYLTANEAAAGTTLLLPGTPVSSGTLPPVGCRLGEAEGQATLLTDLTADAEPGTLWLVEVRQLTVHSLPQLDAACERVAPAAFTVVDGRWALVDARFGDTERGWALVRRDGTRCSSQRLVTRCTLYERYTTPEALQRAAASYGGLT